MSTNKRTRRTVKVQAMMVVFSMLASFFVGFAPQVEAVPTALFFSEYIEGSSYNLSLIHI